MNTDKKKQFTVSSQVKEWHYRGRITPFIVAAEVKNISSVTIAVPLGIVMAFGRREAKIKAWIRWADSGLSLLDPEPWEIVSPEIRLAALEADRQM